MSQIREVLKNSKQGITRDNFKHNVDPITEHEFIMLTSSMWILTLWEYSYKNNAYTGGNSEKKNTHFWYILCERVNEESTQKVSKKG